jgi:hypothetical protein
MTSSGADYDPTFEACTGFGQNTSNAAPSLFLDSIAIDKDCSVYGSLFVTNNVEVGKDVTIDGNIQVKKNLQVGGPGSFGGVVSAAGFTYGGKSFFGANQFVVEAPATFLNSLATNGASSFGGLLSAATGIVSQTLSIPPQFSNNQFSQSQSSTSQSVGNYQPRDADGNPITTPIPFVPCTIGQLPANAVVLAYIPYIEPT